MGVNFHCRQSLFSIILVQAFEHKYKFTNYIVQHNFSVLIILGFVKECKILCFVGLPAIFLVVFFLSWPYSVLSLYSSVNNHSTIIQQPPCIPLLVYL